LANRIFAAPTGMALLCGALAVLGACGDDGGDKPVVVDAGNDAGSPPDSGTGTPPADSGAPLDSGSPLDAGTDASGGPTDAGSAEAAALDRNGITASTARANIVFPIACKAAVTCGAEDDAAACVTEVRGEYDDGVSKGYTAACLDATLDLYSCFATAPCARWEVECTPVSDTQKSICPKADGGT